MQQDPIKVVFDAFDQDKDGYINKQELLTISKELGHELP